MGSARLLNGCAVGCAAKAWVAMGSARLLNGCAAKAWIAMGSARLLDGCAAKAWFAMGGWAAQRSIKEKSEQRYADASASTSLAVTLPTGTTCAGSAMAMAVEGSGGAARLKHITTGLSTFGCVSST